MTFFRVFRGRRWPVKVRAYDLRECPWCMALVTGERGQRRHGEWHEDLDQGAEHEELADVDELEMAE